MINAKYTTFSELFIAVLLYMGTLIPNSQSLWQTGICQPASRASDHFVEFVAVVSPGNVLELASEQIAVLLEERNIPVARIRHDH